MHFARASSFLQHLQRTSLISFCIDFLILSGFATILPSDQTERSWLYAAVSARLAQVVLLRRLRRRLYPLNIAPRSLGENRHP